MNNSNTNNNGNNNQRHKTNQNIQVYVRVRPLNSRERGIRSTEVIDVISPREIMTRHSADSKLTKKFTFDRTFGPESKQADVYNTVVAPLIEEVLSGYNCTVFAYGQTGTGKTHTMVGTECAELKSSWEDDSDIGIIPRALSHLFDELRLMELEFSMRISYLELYNEELCDLLSSDDSTKIRIFDDSTKKGSVIIQGLEEIPVHSKDDVYKLLEKGKERRKTATTLMNAQSSRSHTVFSILVHIRENGIDGEEMLKIGKLNLVDLAGSENVSKAGNEKGIRVRETVNINQSLLTLGRVITALVERTPHIPYRESKLTRLLQESLGGRTKTSIIATISPGHKDIEETLSTLEYAHRAKNIQNKPEVNQKLTKKTILKEYTEEIDKLKRDLMAARDKNGIYLAEETYNELTLKMDSQNRELNEKMLLLKALKDELQNKEKIFNEVSFNLVEKTQELKRTESYLNHTKGELLQTKKILNSTKRRYKEKAAILDHHVKTEQILTSQATKLLEVADLATNDTHQLHNTIERRKDVDEKIQTACEQFCGRMRNNFELLDENLHHFKDQHKSHSNLILEQITNSTKVQNKLLSDAQHKIGNVNKMCSDALNKTNVLCEKFIEKCSYLSEEHKTNLFQLLEELKKKEIDLKNEIQTNLEVLMGYNQEQITAICSMQGHVTDLLSSSTNDLEFHTAQVQQNLKNVERIVESNLVYIAKSNKAIENEKSLNAEESQIIQSFVNQLKAINEKRNSCLTEMQTNVQETQYNEQKVIEHLQESSKQMQDYCQKRRGQNQKGLQDFTDIITKAESIVEQKVAKCSTLQTQVDNLCVETAMHIDNINDKECNDCTHMKNIISDYSCNVKRLRLESENDILLGCNQTQNVISEESKRLKGHITQALAFATSLENHVRNHETSYIEHMKSCEMDLEKFKQSELKIYVPTGKTPSKKDFSYPRILAVTSPHNKILNRLRQENDWSDADTTTTIDEEDDEAKDNLSNDISDTETILNSTPINAKESMQYRGSLSQINSNTLRPPHYIRNSSLPSKLSPCKQSSRNNSPSMLKKNKENLA